MQSLKYKLQKYERKWMKYQLDPTWKVYRSIRNKYYYKLKDKRASTIKDKITDCTNDLGKLHMLIDNLTSETTEKHWPEHASLEDLANGFADYFENKILLIRKHLEGVEPFEPRSLPIPQLRKFASMTQESVLKVITELKTKICELDSIPTHILKQMLPVIADLITKNMNLSLENGEFCRSWKVAIVRLLLKKLELQLINSNFRPVSNLSFISKHCGMVHALTTK